MKATTWVQIIKACLLLAGATLMSLIVLWRFGFSPEAMFARGGKNPPEEVTPSWRPALSWPIRSRRSRSGSR